LTAQPYAKLGDASTNRIAWPLMEPNWLNPREDRAWRAFQHAHHRLGVHLNRGLQESGLSAADYEILAVLSDHDGDRMPAHELGKALGWEKSRVSHQVRRMQKDGLIGREPNPRDREGGTRARGGRPPQLHRPAHPG
jgi:MarR family protein